MNTDNELALPEIEVSDFLQVDIRVGQICQADDNPKSRKPAYILTIDFGKLGKKVSSAQITDNYSKQELLGKKVVAVVNFAPKRIAGVKSEVLLLAAVCNRNGTVIIEPNLEVENGTRIS